MEQGKTILFIGGTGNLGFPLAKAVVGAGLKAKILTRGDVMAAKKKLGLAAECIYNFSQSGTSVEDLKRELVGCSAVHVSLAMDADTAGICKNVVEAAKAVQGIELLSLISGAVVNETSGKTTIIGKDKYTAEQHFVKSGIPYIIWRPSFFSDTLGGMIQGGKATIIGTQPNPLSFLTIADFSAIAVKAFLNKEAFNEIFFVYGPKGYTLKEAMTICIKNDFPSIKKVDSAPFWLMKFFALFNAKMKGFVEFLEYCENNKEPEMPNAEKYKRLFGDVVMKNLEEFYQEKMQKK